ncbi:Alpha-1,6-glucosyltransferase [Thermoflexales bacterium]|nr:Alpha-1,6-glucosyltransferase [Thermoflexales bacterium]
MTETHIYFMSPADLSTPTAGSAPVGGVKVIYKMVDTLNRNGFTAWVLHKERGVRCDWFENDTPVGCIWDTKITASDYLVYPEVFGRHIGMSAQGVRKVIFNQNCYYTFTGYSFRSQPCTPFYTHPDVVATIVVSEDSHGYLKHLFPGLKIHRIRLSVNSDRFSYQACKKNQICFMPRKNEQDVNQVVNILKTRQALHDFDLIAIDGKSEMEVARIMRDSKFFLSFGYPEGFALPPLEAMACGCVVVGYHGMGGQEFFKPEFSHPIAHGDILSYARTVEELVRRAVEQPEGIEAQSQQAAAFVREHYSPRIQERDIVETWTDIFKTSNGRV